jgi:hypothetical protein
MLRLEGSILHRGVSKLMLYHNNKYLMDIKVPLPHKRSQDPFVFFSASVVPVSGVFTFRVESDDRELYAKHYQFLPRIQRFSERAGQLDIRLGQTRVKVPDLDRYFAIGESKPNSETDGMVRF